VIEWLRKSQVCPAMALLDKVPGDLKLYIGGYVLPDASLRH
jgi:hypothetical protein